MADCHAMNTKLQPVARLGELGERALTMGDELAAALQRSLQRFGWLWALGLTVMYALYVCSRASLKPFWFDEVFTTYIARLNGPKALWDALFAGVDLNPPGVYLATRAIERWTGGEGHIRTRLLEIAGYWLMSVCLFRFVQRRCGPLYGLLAALLPIGTIAITYAIEARPYAVVIGFCGLALVAWQAAAEGSLRIVSVPLLALSLAAAVSFHYYAALLFLAFGVAELIRTLRRRRIDFSVWTSIFAGALPLAAYVPLVRNARSYFRGFFVKPESVTIEALYADLFLSGWILMAIVLVLTVRALDKRSNREDTEQRPAVPPEEIGIALLLALLPVVCWGISRLVVGQILVRYALSAVIGCSALVAYALYHWRMRRSYALVLVVLLLAITSKRALVGAKTLMHRGESRPEFMSTVEGAPGTLPVVMFRCLDYIEASYYLPPERAKLTRCIADVEAAYRSSGVDNLDRAVLSLRPYAPINIEDYAPFIAAHREFLLLGRITSPWLISRLLESGAKIEVISQKGSSFWVILHVTLPGAGV